MGDIKKVRKSKIDWLWQIRKEGLDRKIKLEVLSEEITS